MWIQGWALALIMNCVSLGQLPSLTLSFFTCTMLLICASLDWCEDLVMHAALASCLTTGCYWMNYYCIIISITYHYAYLLIEFLHVWGTYEKCPYIFWWVNQERKWKKKVKSLSCARLFATLWTVACTKLLHPWDFQGKSTGVGCHFLFQGIFPTQGSNPGLSPCRQTYFLNYKPPNASSLLQPAITEFLMTFTHLTFLSFSLMFLQISLLLAWESISTTLPDWRKSKPASMLVNLSQTHHSCKHLMFYRFILTHQWPCWTPEIFVMLKYISSDTWLNKWFHSLEHLLEKGFSIFTLFCDRKKLLIKGNRFQDTDENISDMRWGHHAFKHELTEYGVQAESGCVLCKSCTGIQLYPFIYV